MTSNCKPLRERNNSPHRQGAPGKAATPHQPMNQHMDAAAAAHLEQALQRCSLRDCAMEVLARMLDELDVDGLADVERTAKRFKGMALGSSGPAAGAM